MPPSPELAPEELCCCWWLLELPPRKAPARLPRAELEDEPCPPPLLPPRRLDAIPPSGEPPDPFFMYALSKSPCHPSAHTSPAHSPHLCGITYSQTPRSLLTAITPFTLFRHPVRISGGRYRRGPGRRNVRCRNGRDFPSTFSRRYLNEVVFS